MDNKIKEILEEYDHICWYPSAGSDFRPLLYMSEQFYNNYAGMETGSKNYRLAAYPENEDRILPDLFVLCTGNIPDSDILFEHKNEYKFTRICVCAERTIFDDGKGFFADVSIRSRWGNKGKEWKTKLLLLKTDDKTFVDEILLDDPEKPLCIETIINIRYPQNDLLTHCAYYDELFEKLRVKYYIAKEQICKAMNNTGRELNSFYGIMGWIWPEWIMGEGLSGTTWTYRPRGGCDPVVWTKVGNRSEENIMKEEMEYTAIGYDGFVGELNWNNEIPVVTIKSYISTESGICREINKENDPEEFWSHFTAWVENPAVNQYYNPEADDHNCEIKAFIFGKKYTDNGIDDKLPDERLVFVRKEVEVVIKRKDYDESIGEMLFRNIAENSFYICEQLFNNRLELLGRNIRQHYRKTCSLEWLSGKKEECEALVIPACGRNVRFIKPIELTADENTGEIGIIETAFEDYSKSVYYAISEKNEQLKRQNMKYFFCGGIISQSGNKKIRIDYIRINPDGVLTSELRDKSIIYYNDILYGVSFIKKQYVHLETIPFVGNYPVFYRASEEIVGITDIKTIISDLWKLFLVVYPDQIEYVKADDFEKECIKKAFRIFVPERCDEATIDEWFHGLLVEKGVDFVLGIVQESDARIDEFDSYKKMVTKIGSVDTLKKRFTELFENDEKNLFITLAQGFITVITGAPGNAKGALCESLGAGIISKDDEYSRYQNIRASRKWKDRKNFEAQFYKTSGEHYGIFSWLDYEAENKDISEKLQELPYIITINRAGVAPIDEYFEDFIEIRREWYRKKEHTIGETALKIPKTLRFILEMNYDQEGILSRDTLGIVSVVEPDEPYQLAKRITDKRSSITFSDVFGLLAPKSFGPEISEVELWKSADETISNAKVYREIFLRFIQKIVNNVLINGARPVIESRRAEHSVSRYWITARKYLTPEDIPDVNKIKSEYIPKMVKIDEDILDIKGKEVVAGYVALDYALSQLVLPYVTKVKAEAELLNAADIFEFMVNNKLFRCAKLLKQAIEFGRVKIDDELTEESNNELIITKCEKLYGRLLADQDEDIFTDDEALITHICNLVNMARDKNTYTRNVIVNMMICLSQGFLTVFSGKPGCGKTSICRILGGALGLANINDSGIEFDEYETFHDKRDEVVDPSRYLEISTERGWTSKRDFIGYYNPLTEQFDKVNALLYNTFTVLDDQANKSREADDVDHMPCFILLDEANLSPMEYYWADFMNLCEAWSPNNSIDLGGGRVFKIPEELHFIATINNDHTTEILSPRLIDRANVIDLPVPGDLSKAEYSDDNEAVIPVSWARLKEVFGCDESEVDKMDEECHSIYKEIKDEVHNSFSVEISPRTDIAVYRYWTKANRLFAESEVYWIKSDIKKQISKLSDNDVTDITENEDVTLEELVDCIFNRESDDETYEMITIGKRWQALDYAVSQRVLPKLTDVSGKDAKEKLIKLAKKLISNGLLKSAGIVIDMLQRGEKTGGYYNYFR